VPPTPEQRREYRLKNKESITAYNREYYKKNRETLLPKFRDRNSLRDPAKRAVENRERRAANPEKVKLDRKLRAERNRRYVQSLKDVPCHDCGVKYPYYVMQFDHIPERGEKKFNLSSTGGTSRKRVEEEIAKCEIVCANCHTERTHSRRISGQ